MNMLTTIGVALFIIVSIIMAGHVLYRNGYDDGSDYMQTHYQEWAVEKGYAEFFLNDRYEKTWRWIETTNRK